MTNIKNNIVALKILVNDIIQAIGIDESNGMTREMMEKEYNEQLMLKDSSSLIEYLKYIKEFELVERVLDHGKTI